MSEVFWIILVIAVAFGFLADRRSRQLLKGYWSRHCTGRFWRRRFPQASKHEIREFLRLFLNAFGFPQKRLLCFGPEDKVMEIYRALYPVEGEPDGMECEDFVEELQKRYGIDLRHAGDETLSLGDIFALTRKAIG